MGKPKFTKGPWWIDSAMLGTLFIRARAFLDESGRIIASVSTTEHKMEDHTRGTLHVENKVKDAEANARLIAAAPDLYEACKEFIRKVDAGKARSTRSYAQMKAACDLVDRAAVKEGE